MNKISCPAYCITCASCHLEVDEEARFASKTSYMVELRLLAIAEK